MKKLGLFAVVALVLALCASAAFAQMQSSRVVANVPFTFYVGKTELPAGRYEVYPANQTAMDLVIRNLGSGKAIVMPVRTRIESSEFGNPELVFQRVDDKSYLSEVKPGAADGFELRGAPVTHGHTVEGVSRTTVSGE